MIFVICYVTTTIGIDKPVVGVKFSVVTIGGMLGEYEIEMNNFTITYLS